MFIDYRLQQHGCTVGRSRERYLEFLAELAYIARVERGLGGIVSAVGSVAVELQPVVGSNGGRAERRNEQRTGCQRAAASRAAAATPGQCQKTVIEAALPVPVPLAAWTE